MKKTSLLLTFLLLSIITLSAQSLEPTYKGILCYITVDLTNDPVDTDGYLTYTITKPQESINTNGYSFDFGVYGPGSPSLTNETYNTLDLRLRKNRIIKDMLFVEGNTWQTDLEFWVGKYYWSYYNPTYIYEHTYSIVLNIVR
jgi:hypothetical protein